MESMFYYCNLQYLLLLLLHCICSSVSSSPGHLPLRLLLLRLLLLRRDGDVLQEVAEVLGDGWVAAAHTMQSRNKRSTKTAHAPNQSLI